LALCPPLISAKSTEKVESPMLNRISQWATSVIEHSVFQAIIMGFIILVCFFLVIDHYNAPKLQTEIAGYVEIVSLVVFSTEMILMMASLGLYTYFTSLFTFLDFFVVVSSFVELILASGGGLQVLKIVRLSRMVRTAK
ncbi:hypothetical protein CYMTET_32849, partial [Cymbomonas tetramitiformis]